MGEGMPWNLLLFLAALGFFLGLTNQQKVEKAENEQRENKDTDRM